MRERGTARWPVVFAVAFIVGACQTGAPLPAAGGAQAAHVSVEGAMLRTDRTSYAPGEPVRLRLDNRSPDALGTNLCMSMLERRQDARWVDVPAPTDEVCTAELRVVMPGGQLAHDFRFRQDLPAGEYRFRTRLENMATNAGVEQHSNAFQLQR